MGIELVGCILIIQAFILLLGVSLGRSLVTYRLRKEENKSRELEMSLMEQRAQILKDGKKVALNLEELLYRAQVQKEIDDIIRKG